MQLDQYSWTITSRAASLGCCRKRLQVAHVAPRPPARPYSVLKGMRTSPSRDQGTQQRAPPSPPLILEVMRLYTRELLSRDVQISFSLFATSPPDDNLFHLGLLLCHICFFLLCRADKNNITRAAHTAAAMVYLCSPPKLRSMRSALWRRSSLPAVDVQRRDWGGRVGVVRIQQAFACTKASGLRSTAV